ncbi:cytochrome P450 [Tanacetum coccineum]
MTGNNTNGEEDCNRSGDKGYIFRKYGKVEDVFIAEKRNKQGKRFGFARFNEVPNPATFEGLLNSICVGTHKISCNIARFQRRGHVGVQCYHNNNAQPQPPPPANRIRVTGFQGPSYADTLKEFSYLVKPTSKTTLNIQLTFPTLPSLFTSIIAELKNINGASNTHNLILDEGFDNFSIKYLGGLYLLIQLPDHSLASKILSNPTISAHFSSFEPWNNQFQIKERLMWIAISGLPPQLWLSKSFTDIAKHWGKVIIQEDCNTRQFNRTTEKVCILTNCLDFIRETVTISVNKEVISVRVQETEGDIDLLFNGYLFDSTSDEEDTVIGDNDSEKNHANGDNEEKHANNDEDNKEDQPHLSSSALSVGKKSKLTLDENINLDMDGGYKVSEVHAGYHFEDGSSSATGQRVNDILSPADDTYISGSEVSSRHSHSVPPNTSSLKNNNSRKKRFKSLKLIDPINGVRGCATQSRMYHRIPKTISQPCNPTVISEDNEAISDSLSNIQRCNTRILSNPCNATDSESNEVSNTINVGNRIGFCMNRKECEVQRILANGECKTDP